MASPYQQQAFQRKLIYLGSILALFTLTLVWRQWSFAVPMPFVTRWQHDSLEEQANSLGVREADQGEVDLSSLMVRLTLTGSRGLATSVMWMTALDDQKKNQWTELEKDVNQLTKLQPHFITPWLFQSWNLSYNVSVDLDRSSDKYYYIAKGIQLLAKGERQNRYNPVIRWSIGFTYQHKICQHDETNVLRSLFQLSCIPPNQRDPNRFLEYNNDDGSSQIKWTEFEAFCKENPQLIRRLKSGIQRDSDRDTKRQFLCSTPEALVQFLADNFKIESVYETPVGARQNGWVKKEDVLKEEEERFPVLPPPVSPGRDPRPGPVFDQDALSSNSTLNDGHDAYAVSRTWYGYSMEPVPPPAEMPGENTIADPRLHQRIPNSMMTSIFRQYPARAASFMAERLQQEGWFDAEPWPIPGWFMKNGDRFTDGSKAEVTVKDGALSGDAWRTAYNMWERHGLENHMLFRSAADEANMRRLADAFAQREHLPPGGMAPKYLKENLTPDEWEQYNAYLFMHNFTLHTQVTNFHHHYLRAKVEKDSKTVEARKLFYQADTMRISGNPRGAIRLYEQPEAMAAWKAILLAEGNKSFRDDGLIQEDTAEVQLKYLDLVNEDLRPRLQRLRLIFAVPVSFRADRFPRSLVQPPFLDEKGKSIIEARTLETVEGRRAKTGVKAQSKPVEKETPEPSK